MRKLLFVHLSLLLVSSVCAQGYLFTTLAGRFDAWGVNDGTGASALFRAPAGIVLTPDRKLYISDEWSSSIRMITLDGAVTTLAGGSSGTTDGPLAGAKFAGPVGLAADAEGNVYVADTLNHTIRKISAAGIVSTIAGLPGTEGAADGIGASARFNRPAGLVVAPSGNIYVADRINYTIRKITPQGVVSTLAGVAGVPGAVDGVGASARLDAPAGIALDPDGNLLVADTNNHLLRKITPAGVVSTIAGVPGLHGQNDGPALTTALYLPYGLTVDASGTVFFVEPQRVRKLGKDGYVVTLAGSSLGGAADGVGPAARFDRLQGIAIDGAGVLYVTDTDNSIVRKGVPQPLAIITHPQDRTARLGSTVSLSVGASSPSMLRYQWLKGASPVAGATGPELKFVSAQLGDSGSYSVIVSDSTGQLTSQSARLNVVAVPANDLFSAATMLSGRQASVIGTNEGAGVESGEWQHGGQNSTASLWWSWTAPVEPSGLAGNVTIDTRGSAIDTVLAVYEGTAVAYLHEIAHDVSPEGIRVSDVQFAPQSGMTYKIVIDGRAGQLGQIQLNLSYSAAEAPKLVAMSRDMAVISGAAVKLSVQASGGSPLFYQWRKNGEPLPFAPSTYHFISSFGPADVGAYDAVVSNALGSFTSPPVTLTLQPEYAVGAFAGLRRESGLVDGSATTARFSDPQAIAIDRNGNLYVADSGNNSIRKVSSAGVVSTIAGTYGQADGADGVGSAAHFEDPRGIAVDLTGNVYVADTRNHTIRKITPSAVVTTLAGVSGEPGSADGPGAAARFKEPVGIAVDSAGNVFVSDTGNHTIRRITSGGSVTTIAGKAGARGMVDGNGVGARFSGPRGLAIGPDGRLYVADSGNYAVRSVDPGSGTGQSATEVRTFAGNQQNASVDGSSYDGAFTSPLGIAVDGVGNVYVSELYRLRKVTPQGVTSTIAGITSPFDYPYGVAVDGTGKLFLADSHNHIIAVATPPTVPQIKITSSGSAVVGAAWTLSAAIAGGGTFTYQWKKNGVEIAGATQSSFRIDRVSATDAGYYTVTISSGNGSFTSAAVELQLPGIPVLVTAPADVTAIAGSDTMFRVAVESGTAVTYQWQVSTNEGASWSNVAEGALYRGAKGPVLTLITPTAALNGNLYRCVITNATAALTTSSARLRMDGAPRVTAPPESTAVAAGASVSLDVVFAGSPAPAVFWQRNGTTIEGVVGSRLTLTNIQPESAGLYAAYARNDIGMSTCLPAIVGVATTQKALGTGKEVDADVLHPNGNTFDQVLVTGAAVTITADRTKNQITRTSFIDLDDDIVQVEFSGAGTLTLVLRDASSPARPKNYAQEIDYVKGHAGITITGADQTTNVAVFTVGRATAFDRTGGYDIREVPSAKNDPAKNGSPLFVGHAATAYDGIADIAFIAIQSTNGKFGGVRTANTSYFANRGYTGIYAPGVTFYGPVYAGDISAFDSAVPVLMLGAALDATKITGGDLLQANGRPVEVSGLTRLKFDAGADSHGRPLDGLRNQAILQQDGQDVTAQVVVNP